MNGNNFETDEKIRYTGSDWAGYDRAHGVDIGKVDTITESGNGGAAGYTEWGGSVFLSGSYAVELVVEEEAPESKPYKVAINGSIVGQYASDSDAVYALVNLFPARVYGATFELWNEDER